MKVLVVGGTGLTGACTALHLGDKGHAVTIMSRSRSTLPVLQGFPHIAASYIEDQIGPELFRDFDWLVFAAGADIRQLPAGESPETFFHRANTEAIPRFFSEAKAGGISRAVYIGSYYPQVAPEKIQTDVYVRSRHLADEGVRALSDGSFCVCSLNAPFILGHLPGLKVRYLNMLAMYALGQMERIPVIAPSGGVNHITADSMAQAVLGALLRGECGKAYLVGDENLSWKAYLELYFRAAGRSVDLETTTDEHPLFPDSMLYAGRNATVSYLADDKDLGYTRGDVARAVNDIVEANRST